MSLENKITICSTFAQDVLINERGRVIRKQKGGPAFYLLKAFKDENVGFNLITAPTMKVEILIKGGEEYGRIRKRPKPRKINFASIDSPCLLISTLLDEFDLTGISSFKGKVFLDVQGYVRNGKDFGKKKYWKPDKEIINSIFCIKGTEKELKNIPKLFLNYQKQKILIVTKGRSGCELFSSGKRYFIKPKKIVKVTNTIGAGDVFFAYFISQFIQGNDPLLSIKYATEKTSNFLLSKLKISHYD